MVNNTLTFDDLPIEEQTAVSHLKQRMIGVMDQHLYDDLSVFVRFLRARDLNINAAEAMLKHHLEWRKLNQVDTIVTDYTPKEVAIKYITFDSMGLDREGAPILYFNVGGLDSKGLLKSCRKVDLIKTIIQKLENNVLIMKKQSNMLDKHIDKWTMVLNFDGLSFAVATHKETLEIIGLLIRMYEGHYPERLKEAYFINSSMYFTMAFAVVKHILSAKTYRKIKFFGRDGWREELLKIIDPSVLPAFLGGDRTDPDGNPQCLSFITHGGLVPEKYFIKKNECSLANLPGVEKVVLARRSKIQLTLDITELGAHIEWEFETKNRDVGFSLLFKKNNYDSRLKIVIPKQRIETSVGFESGMYKCDKPGIYVIEFDNTYSWIHQKEVYYKITVVKSPLIM